MMKKIFLLTGFSNWGKTTLIYELFRKKKFHSGKTYIIPNTDDEFYVESTSNDDHRAIKFIQLISTKFTKETVECNNFICAFCPTNEPLNNSLEILNSKTFSNFDQKHVLLLKNKWDFHAQLNIDAIKSYLSPIPNIRFFVIDADQNSMTADKRLQTKKQQVEIYLRQHSNHRKQ
jgi:ribosome biogenesis GTPase A